MIGIVSDSHTPSRAEEIPEIILSELDKVEKVVHCGDFDTEEVYRKLEERFEDFTAVRGNCDFFEISVSETFKLLGHSFGVYHGSGVTPRGHLPTLEKIAKEDLGVEVLFTGHTHEERIAVHDSVVVVNPGSCTGVSGGTSRSSRPRFAMLEVEEDLVEVSLKYLEEGEIVEGETERIDLKEMENQ